MKKLIFILGAFPTVAFADGAAMDYVSVACSYSFGANVQTNISYKLMALAIGEDAGRFVQIQFGDENKVVQYQLLFENDPKIPGAVLVLQNLKVDALESSSEFSAKDVSFVRIAQGEHSVSCTPTKN